MEFVVHVSTCDISSGERGSHPTGAQLGEAAGTVDKESEWILRQSVECRLPRLF